MTLLSCSEKDDVNYKINNNENFKLTLESNDPRVDESFEITKESTLLSGMEIYDNINDTTWNYHILLPPDYNMTKIYPVLYLLHGKSALGNTWFSSLDLKRISDVYYTRGGSDMIIVTPDAGDTYYMDDYIDNIKYDTYFHHVLRPYIETTYPISPEREKHFIGGWSMGGYGAIYYAFKYCDDFAFCYAMSAPVTGRVTSNVPSLFDLIKETQVSFHTPYVVLDIGESDSFMQSNLDAHWLFIDLEMSHELILRDGGHEREFWQKGLYFLFDRMDKYVASKTQ